MFATFHPVFMLIRNNPDVMRKMAGKLGKVACGLFLIGAAAGMLCPELALAAGKQPPPKPAAVLGTYKLVVRGWLQGPVSGNGSPSGAIAEGMVNAGVVSIRCQVADRNGNVGVVLARCVLDGDHFQGTGTFLNSSMVIEGRVEGPDPGHDPKAPAPPAGTANAPVVTHAHLGATFRLDDGHSGRIAGVMVSSAGGG